MKTLLKILSLVIVFFFFSPTPDLLAQEADTVDIAVLPPGNVNNVIGGDTLAGGVRANPNRVYRLERGRIYQVTQSMRINGNIKVIATEGDGRPPVLAPAILEDASSIDHFFDLVGKGSNVEIHNLYLLSVRADQAVLGWSDGIRVNADSVSLKLNGVIFDAFSNRGLSVSAHWSKLNVQNCVFRNHMHASGAYYGGGPYQSDAPYHMDTCIFRNNTFFSNNSCNWSIRGYDKHSVFEHNTIAYGIVYTFLLRQASNLYVKNNLFYSPQSFGGTQGEVYGGSYLHWPDTVSTGIFAIRSLDTVSSWYQRRLQAGVDNVPAFTGPEVYTGNGVTEDMLLVQDRNYEITNNAYYWPQELKDFYNTFNDTTTAWDSLETIFGTKLYEKRRLILPSFITEYTQMTFDSLLAPFGANVNVTNNMEVDPGFTDAGVLGHVNNVTTFVGKIATANIDSAWWYNPTGQLYPPQWPLPENLRYTNAALMTASTDGRPLGDLNWFKDIVDVEDGNSVLPVKYSLSEAYPNPFNPETNFDFSIGKAGNVKITVFNLLGQKVKTLLNSELNAGSHTAKWNGTDDFGYQVPSGIYFYRLESGSFNSVKKMVLMK